MSGPVAHHDGEAGRLRSRCRVGDALSAELYVQRSLDRNGGAVGCQLTNAVLVLDADAVVGDETVPCVGVVLAKVAVAVFVPQRNGDRVGELIDDTRRDADEFDLGTSLNSFSSFLQAVSRAMSKKGRSCLADMEGEIGLVIIERFVAREYRVGGVLTVVYCDTEIDCRTRRPCGRR